MAQAVIGVGKKGAIGDRYVVFEVRSSVDRSTCNGPKLLNGRRRDEDCLAKSLQAPVVRDEEDPPGEKAKSGNRQEVRGRKGMRQR